MLASKDYIGNLPLQSKLGRTRAYNISNKSVNCLRDYVHYKWRTKVIWFPVGKAWICEINRANSVLNHKTKAFSIKWHITCSKIALKMALSCWKMLLNFQPSSDKQSKRRHCLHPHKRNLLLLLRTCPTKEKNFDSNTPMKEEENSIN